MSGIHLVAQAAGYLGSVLGVGMVLPQIGRTLRDRSLPGVSALSWSLTAVACTAWLLYGIRARELPQIPGNVLLVGGAVLVALLVPNRVPAGMRAARLLAAGAAVALIAVWAPTTALGLLAFGIGLFSSLPQLVTSLRRPADEPSSLSVSAWLLRCGSQVLWLFYAIVVHDLPVTISATVSFSSAVLILAVEARRRPAAQPAPAQPLTAQPLTAQPLTAQPLTAQPSLLAAAAPGA
jgi:uncharacterized protein with PQ loop repeat